MAEDKKPKEVNQDLVAYMEALENIALNFTHITTPEEWVDANSGLNYFEATIRLPLSLKDYIESIDKEVRRALKHTVYNDIVGDDVIRDLLYTLMYTGLTDVANVHIAKAKKEENAVKEAVDEIDKDENTVVH